jgi:major vault protein
MADVRESEYVLAPGEFVYVADQNTGLIKVSLGPCKINLQMTDLPMNYDAKSKRFTRCLSIREAVQLCTAVDERSYVILHNPSKSTTEPHPKPSAQNTYIGLEDGKMVNLKGPCTFALWPGQIAEVIKGHQLRSNEYLVVEVYNAAEALKEQEEGIIVTGQLLTIKGTEQSFYIPPTGYRVVKENDTGDYVRSAVTLERLEYCILLDESGEKRYVPGPDVVFPEPTEEFVTVDGNRKYKALELNEQMGIHVKFIADYEEGGKKYDAGDEVFITGATRKIYYPRSEHAIIKYGDQVRQYAIAIPSGEGRYVLEKLTGNVKMVRGPMMYLPNPIHEVLVRRVLTSNQVKLWFPNNPVALEHNLRLAEIANSEGALSQNMTYVSDDQVRMRGVPRSMSKTFSAPATAMVSDEMRRSTTYQPPRTITLDNKFEGSVFINIWPSFAVQVVSRSGERRVIQGPKSILLEYDETLEVLSLSRGRPKTSDQLIETPYLRINNNRVSDLVEAETRDMVPVQIEVYYRVNFEGDPNKWFSTENYVQFMADHLRSLIRNTVKKIGIEELTNNAADTIRDNVLGKSENGKRAGRVFEENGMRVYDIEILKVSINNPSIAQLLLNTQYHTVSKALEAVQKAKTLEVTQKLTEIEKQLLEAAASVKLKDLVLKQQEAAKRAEIALSEFTATEATQAVQNTIHDATVARVKVSEDLRLEILETEKKLDIQAFKEKMGALQPGLIEAINNAAKMAMMTELTSKLPQATGGLGFLLGQGGMTGLMKMVQGNPMLEEALKNLNK